MKIKLKNVKIAAISSDFIRLDSLLKFLSLVDTGGQAKDRIQNGDVFVNGNICVQRGKKIRPGDLVRLDGTVFSVTKSELPGSFVNYADK